MTGSMTISAWINSSALPADDAAIVSKREAGSVGFQLDTTIDRGPRTIGFKLTTSTGGTMYRYGATAMATNTWYHVAGVYDATARTMNVYLNGQLDNGVLVGTVSASQMNSSQNVNIGRRPGYPGASEFLGAVDEVRIYNRVLSPSEIQTDMADGNAPPTDSVAPTVSLTAPSSGATVSGSSVTVSAAASDNVGVAGVLFTLDGNPLGAEDTQAPYSIVWNTNQATNSSHVLRAIARDAAGNQGTSSAVSVTVSNAGPPTSYSVPEGGVQTWSINGSTSVQSGSLEITPSGGGTAPAGAAMIGYRVGGVLVTETGVSVSGEILSGRVYVNIGGSRTTKIVMENQNNWVTSVNYSFIDTNGIIVASGATNLATNSRTLASLNQAPFNGPDPFHGTFTFTASTPIFVAAIRELTNELGEPVLATLPVIPSGGLAGEVQTLPHVVAGNGYLTEIVLLNPGGSTLTGTAQFFSSDTSSTAPPLAVNVDGVVASSFSYQIPPRGLVRKIVGDPNAMTLQVGSARITPSGSLNSPWVLEILDLRQHEVTVSETAFSAVPPGTALRMYVESSGGFGSLASARTGVALANPSATATTVTMQIFGSDGTSAGTASVVLPGNGHLSRFIQALFPSLPLEFKGVMRLSANAPFSALSVRTRYNERGDFLFAMAPISNEATPTLPGSSAAIPYLALGGGYSTDLVLYDTAAGTTNGSLAPILSTDNLLPR
jgi:hypothetical protein